MKKKLFCICVILCFIAEILGNTNTVKTMPNYKEAHTAHAEAIGGNRLMSAGPMQCMDDFHMQAKTNGVSSPLVQLVRGRTLPFLAVGLCLFFGFIYLAYRPESEEKQIYVFAVVSFIHRTDGKKKSCFERRNTIKTGGFSDGSWYQI